MTVRELWLEIRGLLGVGRFSPTLKAAYADCAAIEEAVQRYGELVVDGVDPPPGLSGDSNPADGAPKSPRAAYQHAAALECQRLGEITRLGRAVLEALQSAGEREVVESLPTRFERFVLLVWEPARQAAVVDQFYEPGSQESEDLKAGLQARPDPLALRDLLESGLAMHPNATEQELVASMLGSMEPKLTLSGATVSLECPRLGCDLEFATSSAARAAYGPMEQLYHSESPAADLLRLSPSPRTLMGFLVAALEDDNQPVEVRIDATPDAS